MEGCNNKVDCALSQKQTADAIEFILGCSCMSDIKKKQYFKTFKERQDISRAELLLQHLVEM